MRRLTDAWEVAHRCDPARDPSILPAYVAHDRIVGGSRSTRRSVPGERGGAAPGPVTDARFGRSMPNRMPTSPPLERRPPATTMVLSEGTERRGRAISSNAARVVERTRTVIPRRRAAPTDKRRGSA